MYPVFILGGLLIPPVLLPRWVGWASTLTSLRWAREFLAGAAVGAPRPADLGMVLLLTAGYAVAGVAAFARVSDLARERGTLELS
jgi:ABC-2 type transport system permease protein